MPISNHPQLSVVIASLNSERTIEKCLRSLENQVTEGNFEVIVVDSSTDRTAALVEKRFPFVKLFKFTERKFCGDARNWGISVAKATIIAFLDADCTVGPHWIEEVVNAHRSSHLAIGGVIDNASRRSLVGWGYYFCEFSLWMPPLLKRSAREVAGCCLSLKRSAFDQYGPFLEGRYCSDTAFLRKLRRDGHQVFFFPGIRVYHVTTYNLQEFVKHIANHRRDFAEIIGSGEGISLLRRATSVMASPLMPFLLFSCIAIRVLRRRIYLPQFMLSSPIVFLGAIARSWGEFLGYVRKKRLSPYAPLSVEEFGDTGTNAFH